MAVNCSPLGPKPQIELSSGLPAVGGLLFFYVAGSVGTKVNTYTTSTGLVANANPIVLNALGQPNTEIWFTAGQSYKIVLAPSTDTDPPTSPIWTIDNLFGINDTTVTVDQWIAGPAPTYVSGTQFTLVGDQTGTFQVNRRVKTTNTIGTVYSTISTSVFGVVTTVTVVNDSLTLDNGLSAVSYGLLSRLNDAIPRGLFQLLSGLGSLPVAAAGGTVDAITATYSPAITLTDQQVCAIVSSGASTSANPTFTPNALTTHTITTRGGAVLVAGDIGPAGFIAIFEYNLANTRWELLNPAKVRAASDLVGVAPLTAGGTGATSLAGAGIAILGANTFTADQTLAENAGLVLDAALSADGKYSGIVEAGTAAATLAFGEICYLVTASSRWDLAKADAASTSSNQLGICVLAAAGNGSATTMLLYGKVRADALFDTFTVGAPLYISAATAGKIVSAAPTGTVDFVQRKIGSAEDGNTVFFTPDNNYTTIDASSTLKTVNAVALPANTGGITTILAPTSLGAGTTYDIINIPATYAYLVLQIAGASSDTAARLLMVQVSTNNGISFDTTANNYLGHLLDSGTIANTTLATLVTYASTASAAETGTSTLILYGYQGGVYLTYDGRTTHSATDRERILGTYVGSTSAINALRVLWNGTGNFDAGTAALYGVS